MQVSIENIGSIFKDAEKKCIKACINTVNIQAATSRKEGIISIKNQLTLRNNFTERNIVYTQCPQNVTNINQIQSEIGATTKVPYMARQEEGGMHNPKQGKQLAIPSTMARGGNNAKKVMFKFNYSNIKTVGKALKATTRSSRYVARAFVASKNKMLMSVGTKTLFQITNFKKSGGSISFKQTPIYNLKFHQTQTPPAPWLRPATEQQAKEAQQIFNYQLDKIFTGV